MKWNFPLIRKLIQFHKNYGLTKTILFVIFIFLGTKIIIFNGTIMVANYFFCFGWKYAPVLQYLDRLVYL